MEQPQVYYPAIEDKLDEDFLFYFSLSEKNIINLKNGSDIDLCQTWLRKLCGEHYVGVSAKQTRNVFLANLILAMQSGRMVAPFLDSPPEGPLQPFTEVFGPNLPENLEDAKPTTLEQTSDGFAEDSEFDGTFSDGRTYIAAQVLPEQEGCLGYFAVTLVDDDSFSPVRAHPLPHSTSTADNLRDFDNAVVTSQPKAFQVTTNSAAYYDNLIQIVESTDFDSSEINSTVARLLDQLSRKLNISFNNHPERKCYLMKCLQLKLTFQKAHAAHRQQVLNLVANVIHPIKELTQKDSFCEETCTTNLEKQLYPKNVQRLGNVYQGKVVNRFVALLGGRKADMLSKYQQKITNHMQSVIAEMDREMKLGIAECEEACDEWLRLFVILQDVTTTLSKFKHNGKPVKSDRYLTEAQLEKELKLIKENHEAEMKMKDELIAVLESENTHLSEVINQHKQNTCCLLKYNAGLKKEICNLDQEITKITL